MNPVMEALIDRPLLILAFIISLSAALFSLPRLSRVAIRFGLVDRPSRRKTHGAPKPLTGGVGMALAVFLSLFLCMDMADLAGLLAGMLTLLIVGSLDDRRELNCWWKFCAQVAAALMVVRWSGVSLHTFGDLLSLGPIGFHDYSIPVTVFCIVGVVNAFNMIDGMDGLAGGVSLIAFLCFACVSALGGHSALMVLSVAMCGAITGFLRYNWFPSRLFMGDAGSLFLGFTAAFVSIEVTQGGQGVVRPVVPLLILAVPVTDTLTVIVKRITNGKSPFRADRDHFHHILLRMGLGTRGSVAVILLISLLFSSLAIAGTLLRIPEHHLFLVFSLYFVIHLELSLCTEHMLKKTVPCHAWDKINTCAATAVHEGASSPEYCPLRSRHATDDNHIPPPDPSFCNRIMKPAAADETQPDEGYVCEPTCKGHLLQQR